MYSIHKKSEVNLEDCIDTSRFYEIAENIFNNTLNPNVLIEYSTLVSKREPGGAFYRAKFLAKAMDLLGIRGDKKRQKKYFNKLCNQVGISASSAKEYLIQGRAIEKLEQSNITASKIRNASSEILIKAQKQKKLAGEYLIEAAKNLENNMNLTPNQIHRLWCKKHGSIQSRLDIIKPSDWWAFSHPKWRKEDDFPGSIPGEIYANALYYFAPKTGIAIDVMAGSGMLKRVYDDRHRWQKNSSFNLEIHLFDLYPSKNFIKRHDASQPLPVKADWIFVDPPYFGQSSHLYKGKLAQTEDYKEYLNLLDKIVIAMRQSLNNKGRLCIFLPKWSGLNLDHPNYDIPTDVYSMAIDRGLSWIDTAFVSRGRQQEGGSAMKNISAKANRRMRSDTCVLNVFEKRKN